MVTEVNVHEGDLKIEFLHLSRPTQTFRWPSIPDKKKKHGGMYRSPILTLNKL